MENIVPVKSKDVVSLISSIHGDQEQTKSLCKSRINYYNNKPQLQQTELEERWYQSLKNQCPDYSVYSDEEYVFEATACYVNYSRHYIKLVHSVADKLPQFTNIYDMGCGVGLSTALLKHYWPETNVYGTQVNGLQYTLASKISNIYNFKLLPDLDNVPNKIIKQSMIIALDYAEHFQRPFEHFVPIIQKEPKIMVFANSFASKSVGHFDLYISENGNSLESKKTGREFNKMIKNFGYQKLNVNFYNSRPTIWIKSNS